jgi:glycine hydroxymethyltransferase
MTRIAIGSDHGGFDIKEAVRRRLAERGVEVEDVGCFDKRSVDYPDFARDVAGRVSSRSVDMGVLVCTTGIGMSMAANKFPGVRAALCMSPEMARMARTHNDANILVMGSSLTSPDTAGAVVDEWLSSGFSHAERHERRVRKIGSYGHEAASWAGVEETDPDMAGILKGEIDRQQHTINFIASENYVSPAVRCAQGSVLTNKYAEGYPGKRWYNGCAFVDAAERLAIARAKQLFGAEHANVQPHCGSSANMAVYFSALSPGDTILAMKLTHGGHLTHGKDINFSGRFFRIVSYGVRRDTERLDYDEIMRLARESRPKLIVAGASAYPRTLDFVRFREVAESVGARLMVDMAHIAGLIAGGAHPSPVPYADFVTGTTHKTLRGPRGGVILCRQSFQDDIDRAIFPGIQGGPEMHTVAAKAVCLNEALQPEFHSYAAQVVRNAKVMAETLLSKGFRLVSGGTDNHLMLVDLTPFDISGRDAAAALEQVGIVLNKNVIPFDTRNPFQTSGIRIGTPAATTRGMKEPEMRLIGGLIADVLRQPKDEALRSRVHGQIRELADQFPVP